MSVFTSLYSTNFSWQERHPQNGQWVTPFINYFFLDMVNTRIKHGGVLALSACVLAFPYDVPEWMPEVLIEIGNYVHDSPQIQVNGINFIEEEKHWK